MTSGAPSRDETDAGAAAAGGGAHAARSGKLARHLNTLQRVGSLLLDTYAPLLCLFCDLPFDAGATSQQSCSASRAAICPDCFADLLRNGGACPHCALPDCHGALCPECLGSRRLPCRVLAPFVYDSNIAFLLRRWKYEGQRSLCETAAALLLIQHLDVTGDFVALATPLHWRRRMGRGFNQSEDLLSAAARRHSGLNAAQQRGRRGPQLRRCRATTKQSLIRRRERQRNLDTAFEVDGRFRGEHVFLVDDVCTTGETARAMTRALHRAGAGKVTLLCLARTPHWRQEQHSAQDGDKTPR
ncbi:MAG: ComF family protein [Halieaceae bacterium]|nr:ComF family protein [Halieaceae bacterium]